MRLISFTCFSAKLNIYPEVALKEGIFLQKSFTVIKSLHIKIFSYPHIILMFKLILSYFLFSTSYITLAAGVAPTVLTDSPIQFLEQKQPTDKSANLAILKVSQNTEEVMFYNAPENTSAQIENSNHSGTTSLKNFAKNFNHKYTENKLFQESLSRIHKAKQLWDMADSQVNIYANDLVFTLKLEQFTKKYSINTQANLHNSIDNFYSSKNASYKNSQSSELSVSDIQQAYAYSDTQGINELSHNYIASLFQINTVYYLIALYILFMLLIWVIKFTLRFFP